MSSKKIIDLRNARAKPVFEGGRTRVANTRKVVRKNTPRSSPVRTRRRRVRALLLTLVAFLFFGIVYAIHVFSYDPRVTVHEVEILGGSTDLNEGVRVFTLSQLSTPDNAYFSRYNIFRYDVRPLITALYANFPRIAQVTGTRTSIFSTRLSITLKERAPIGT